MNKNTLISLRPLAEFLHQVYYDKNLSQNDVDVGVVALKWMLPGIYEEILRLRASLAFYADEDNYDNKAVVIDRGNDARVALGLETEE